MEDYQEVYDRRCDDHGIKYCARCLAKEGVVDFIFPEKYIPPKGDAVDFIFSTKKNNVGHYEDF